MQTTNMVFLVRPASFSYNTQTAAVNIPQVSIVSYICLFLTLGSAYFVYFYCFFDNYSHEVIFALIRKSKLWN
ncbi:MAG: Unknown protein [uncultured Aureispira sp.]|uniref:Uncharacterized protein n=1 Tax=uncultured Aureispira sp. TaxID=1331704 RepID=A0A6S6UB64_9BACT|nr:MAG: Unknown protein [uncultured Aureispira sp.]